MSKYQILLNILDQLRKEAPSAYKSYHPLETDTDKITKARSRALIHLYLKVKFGLLNFADRENWVTEGSDDGGIDAYYIDEKRESIYLIQSKFRANEKNFEIKEINPYELLQIDIQRILKGETSDRNGKRYNDKIQALIKKLQNLRPISHFTYHLIILANVTKLEPHLERLFPEYIREIMNFERCYNELVFPLIKATYHQASDLYIDINLADKEYSSSRVRYYVQTRYLSAKCEINVLFVPTLEIAKNFYKYKNALLKYNPRSYLGLANNPVNRQIKQTIEDTTTNEFSLFNNGITMLSTFTRIQEDSGQIGQGQLRIQNPQIINGAQTAYTLSSIYETALSSGEDPKKIFKDKEVMLKVIVLPKDSIDEKSVLDLIAEISKATNSQSSVKEADRRANDRIQVELQDKIFKEFGYFYERKKGELSEGITKKYLDRSVVIDRQIFLRVCHAILGSPAEAYRIGEKQLFLPSTVDRILNSIEIPKAFFAFLCYKKLQVMRKAFQNEKNNKFGRVNYGGALAYGSFAVIFISHSLLRIDEITANIEALVDENVNSVLGKWLAFEIFAKSQSHNSSYFRREQDPSTGGEIIEIDLSSYYRGDTLKNDLITFFQL